MPSKRVMPSLDNFNPYAPPVADVDQGLQHDPGEYILADRGTRLAAWLIDWLLLLAAYIPGFVLLFALVGLYELDFDRSISQMNDGVMIGVFGVFGLMVLSFQVYQWYLISTTGQSLAKRWLGIMIVRTDGTSVGFVNGVLLRSWLMYLIGNIPIAGIFVFLLVDPLMIFGDERRCLHDQIAGTRVIVAPKA